MTAVRNSSLIVVLSLVMSLALVNRDSAINPTAFNLPQGPGAITGLGELFSAQANTGTSAYELPIWVPPGRSTLVPQLVVQHSSGYGNGLLGLGRRLSIAFIRTKVSPTIASTLGPMVRTNLST